MHRNNGTIIFSIVCLAFIIFLSIFSFKIEISTATVIWSDNFDDGNYNDWIVQTGTFSATDHMLKATGNNTDWNNIYFVSDLAYGTWSFDVYIDSSSISIMEHMYIQFLMLEYGFENEDSYELSIWLDTRIGSPGFTLLKRVAGTMTILGEYEVSNGLSSFQHIDITRDLNGNFDIFINGTILIEAVDTTWTTSLYFRFASMGGNALDNISVDNEVLNTTNGSASGIMVGTAATTLWIIVVLKRKKNKKTKNYIFI
jgi:hypothetical protein